MKNLTMTLALMLVATQAAAVEPFANDEAGRLLAKQISAVYPDAAGPLPVRGSAQLGGSGNDVVPLRLWPVPEAIRTSVPQILPTERLPVIRVYPAVDEPPLAAEATPTLPRTVVLLAVAGGYVDSPNADAVGPLLPLGTPLVRKVTARDDPSAAPARGLMTSTLVITPPLSPPRLPLGIPNPFANAEAVQLGDPPADNDPPVAGFDRPTVVGQSLLPETPATGKPAP